MARMAMDNTHQETTPTIDLELRRGVLVLAALRCLHAEAYGYALKKTLAEGGLDIDEGTLYPLLRRLEAQGLLASEWRVEEGRPRRYYRTSTAGLAAEAGLTERWRAIVAAMDRILDDGGSEA